MTCRNSALESCVELLPAEANATMLDIVCTSLNVPKVDVYLHAGDIRAQDGKFAKAVLYYKIAGVRFIVLTNNVYVYQFSDCFW